MRARILRVTLVAIALTITAFSAQSVFAAQANITKAAAKTRCEDWHQTDGIEFKPKKHWVAVGKGRKCVGIKFSDGRRQLCYDLGGKPSTKENGKFDCIWDDGFAPEPNPDEVGAGPNNTGKEKLSTDVTDVVGVGTSDGKCVKSAIIWTKKVGDEKYFCDESGSGTYETILIVFNIFSAAIGVLGVLGLVFSGITYLTARDNEQQVAKAKKRIVQILIGLGIYAALYLLLQWIIPGGIFGG